ncbi:MAG: glycosyltransferase [Solirubrobacterales bacterium]|nr:glycosyltransferase [Solirubrobacterales bacterium]
MGRLDVLVVTVDSTQGWRSSSRELTEAIRRAGASAEAISTPPAREVRTFALTDLVQARAARKAAAQAIATLDPRAVIYCSITAALLWPRPGAIWVDSIASENRPGRHGIWQRPVERRRLERAPLVLMMGQRSLAPLKTPPAHAVLVPSPVAPSGPLQPPAQRDIAALAYVADPQKRRLDHILSAWTRARLADERLLIAGIAPREPIAGVEWAGRLPPTDYRALLRRTRVFVTAPRHEDYGIAALEALADGCLLVTTPAPGPYPALALARELDPRLVTDDLAAALRTALDDPLGDYAERARPLLAPFSRAALDRTLAERVLPLLLEP